MCELGPYYTAVAVCSCDFAPDDSDLAALSFFGGFVYECYSLSEVKPAIIHVSNRTFKRTFPQA